MWTLKLNKNVQIHSLWSFKTDSLQHGERQRGSQLGGRVIANFLKDHATGSWQRFNHGWTFISEFSVSRRSQTRQPSLHVIVIIQAGISLLFTCNKHQLRPVCSKWSSSVCPVNTEESFPTAFPPPSAPPCRTQWKSRHLCVCEKLNIFIASSAPVCIQQTERLDTWRPW